MSITTDINGIYQSVLQRDAEPDGVTFWTNAYAGGMSLEQIQADIIQSPEAQNDVVPIIELYQTALGRQADAGGLAYWVHQLETGASLQSIAAGFAASTEGRAAFNGSTVSEHFVEEVYSNALGRAAAPDEVGYWMSTGLSQGQILMAINNSAEAQGQLGDHPELAPERCRERHCHLFGSAG